MTFIWISIKFNMNFNWIKFKCVRPKKLSIETFHCIASHNLQLIVSLNVPFSFIPLLTHLLIFHVCFLSHSSHSYSLSFSLSAWSPQPGEAPPENNYNLKQRSEPRGTHHQSSRWEQPQLMWRRRGALSGQKAAGSKHTLACHKHQTLSPSMTNNNRPFANPRVTLLARDLWEVKKERLKESKRRAGWPN